MKLKILLPAILLLLTVQGCSSGPAPSNIVFFPIRPTAGDMVCMSDRLVDQILTHDLTGQKLYGWKP